jgi:predicted SnoaL-like aldol condensation-catalyzing enzyme
MKRLRLVLWVLILCAAAVTIPSAASAETARETANKQVVIGYFRELDRLEKLSHDEAKKEFPPVLAKYCRPDYIQHNESMAAYGQGTAGLMRMFDSASAGPTLGASHVVTVMALGDLVVRINTREMPGRAKPLMIFNLFRLQDGLIAEHWDGYSGVNPAMPLK